uniref:THD domain-containing protein n=1 Tax=Latimeria chalumnae TaxID=7897 RepID=H3ARE3_LATCH
GMRNRRRKREPERSTHKQSFLHLVAKRNTPLIQQAGSSTVIPLSVAIKHGQALSEKENRILVHEDGYYMVFGQIMYFNTGNPMGHIIQRRKFNVVGSESREVALFRCVQSMPKAQASNSCYTAGFIKLDQGDELELLIPDRPYADVSVNEDSTFFGALQLL